MKASLPIYALWKRGNKPNLICHFCFFILLGQPRYRHDAAMDKSSETHSGEEVAIYARGPMSHLFHGTHEQNYIAQVLMYAACIGPNKDNCERPRQYPQCGPDMK